MQVGIYVGFTNLTDQIAVSERKPSPLIMSMGLSRQVKGHLCILPGVPRSPVRQSSRSQTAGSDATQHRARGSFYS